MKSWGFRAIWGIIYVVCYGHGASAAPTAAELWDAEANYSQTEIKIIPSTTDFATKIPLTLIRLKNSGWTEDEVLAKVRRTEDIFKQCQWSFSPITLVSTVHAQGPAVREDKFMWEYDYSYVDLDRLILQNVAQKPALFLVDTNYALLGDGGVSMRKGLVKPGSPEEKMKDSAIIYREFALEEQRNSGELDQPGNYEVMAHELSHLLFDQSHIEGGKNIMTGAIKGSEARTNTITAEQCANGKLNF